MNDVRAALLAGGKGERLGRLTEQVIKPLVPYAGTCRLIDFSLVNSLRSGIQEVVLMSAERERDLIDHIATHWDACPEFHVHLGPNERLRDPHRPIDATIPLAARPVERGTADALLTNADYVFSPPARDILILHADHVYLYDYRPMIEAHRRSGADATIGVQRIERRFVKLFGMVQVDESGRVTQLVEKPAEPTSELIFTAFGLFRADVLLGLLREFERLPVEGWQHDISRDVLPEMLARGMSVRAFETEGFWADIGTVERYHLGHQMLLGSADLLPEDRLPHTLGGPDLRAGPDGCRLSTTARLEGDVRSTFAYSGSAVESGGVAEDCVLLPGARVTAGTTARRTVVLENEVLRHDRVGLDTLEVRTR